MKKTLVALAVLAATGTAFAQSSVSISGRIDLGHANITTEPVGGTSTKTTSLAGDQQGRTTSRLTFAGQEDLGAGLTASFNYETRLNPDNTAAAGMDRTRNMFLNLRGGFGGVTIGTYLNPLDAVRGFSAATYSAPGGDFLANHIGAAGLAVTDTKLGTDLTAAGIVGGVSTARALAQNGLSGRSTNSIGYSSPSFDGFTFGLGLSQEKVSTGPVLNEANGFIGSVAYAKGPLSARLAYGEGESEVRTSSTANNTNSAKSTDTSFAVSYNLGVAVPYLQYEATKVDVNQIGGTAFNKEFASNATEIGSTFPMGAFTPYVTFGAGELEYAGSSIKTSAYQLGTTYALSKRTYVYGGAGRFKVDTVAETTGYKLGLVHSF